MAKKASPVLQEVVVTADRRNSFSADYVQAGSFRGARALDTPLTVSVIPSALIKSQLDTSLLGALRNTAGVTAAQTSPVVFNNLSIRGIAVDNRENYRLDGALPILNLIDLPLEDKDRVEALKGASALYYGFTTPSGIINMVMKRPTPKPYAEATLFGDDNGGGGGHIDLGDTWGMFGARINAVYAAVEPGIDHTGGDRSLLSGAFDFKPFKRLVITLDVESIYKRVGEPGVFDITTLPKATVANPYPAIPIPALPPASQNFGVPWGRTRAQETNVLGHASYKISKAWSIDLDAGQSQETRDRRYSFLNPLNDITGAGVLSVGLAHQSYENRTIRGEIVGTFYTGPFLHEALIGASENILDQVSPATQLADCAGGVTKTPSPVTCAQNFFHPRTNIPETAIPYVAADTSRIDDVGYYAFDRVKLGQWLQVLGGVRQSDYTQSDHTTGAVTYHATPLSYSYGAVLKPRPWASVYGTFIEGLESTAPAPFTAANAGQQLAPSQSVQREGGVKLEPLRGLLFQAAYFNIKRASTYTNSDNVYVEDGRAQYKGEEFSLTGELNPRLSLYGSVMLLSAKQIAGAPTVITTSGAGVVTVTPTAVGKFIENTPKQTYSLAAEYKFLNWLPGFSMNGAVYFTGRRAINSLDQAFVPSFTTVDLGAAYATQVYDHPTVFRVYGENIGGARYWAATGAYLLAESPPGVVKFEVSTKF